MNGGKYNPITRDFKSDLQKIGGFIMKKCGRYASLAAVALLFVTGCSLVQQEKKLPSEDIEIFKFHPHLISILKNPNLPPNGKEKYEAAREIIRKVDFSFTRESKTLNEIFFHGDAIIDSPNTPDRTISFNYQYGDHYVRFRFFMYRNFVLRTEVTEK